MYNLNTCNIWHSIQLSSCGKCIVYDNSVYSCTGEDAGPSVGERKTWRWA